jgi:hypothetical protein
MKSKKCKSYFILASLLLIWGCSDNDHQRGNVESKAKTVIQFDKSSIIKVDTSVTVNRYSKKEPLLKLLSKNKVYIKNNVYNPMRNDNESGRLLFVKELLKSFIIQETSNFFAVHAEPFKESNQCDGIYFEAELKKNSNLQKALYNKVHKLHEVLDTGAKEATPKSGFFVCFIESNVLILFCCDCTRRKGNDEIEKYLNNESIPYLRSRCGWGISLAGIPT